MNKKLSPQLTLGVVAVALALFLALGIVWYRNFSGEKTASDTLKAMEHSTPGKSPFTPEQMQKMRGQGKPAQ